MKYKGWLIALLLIAAVCIIWWLANERSGNKDTLSLKPNLSVAAVSISDIDSKRIKMNTRAILNNPLPVELRASGIDYQLLINKRKILEDSYSKEIVVRSDDSSSITLPMEILVEPLTKVLQELEKEKSDSADYTLVATLKLDLPIKGETAFDFTVNERLPSFRLPKLRPEEIDIHKLAIKESKMRIDLIVENPNLFPFKMKDVDYDVKVGDDIAMEGKIDGITNIPAKSTVTVPVDLEVKNKEMIKLLGKTLFGSEDTKFAVDFNCSVISENELLKGSKMALHTDGTVGELKEAMKNIKKEK